MQLMTHAQGCNCAFFIVTTDGVTEPGSKSFLKKTTIFIHLVTLVNIYTLKRMDILVPEILNMIFGHLTLAENARLRQVSQWMKLSVGSYLKRINHICITKNIKEVLAMHPIDYWYRFTPVKKTQSPFIPIHSSLWPFINKYCGESIELHHTGRIGLHRFTDSASTQTTRCN